MKSKALTNVQKFFPAVTKVKDSTHYINVEVTERDDKNSRLKNHAECALATCVKRSEKADGVVISVSTAYVVKGDVAYRYKVPESAAREVVSFDRKGGFAPGEYSLRPPSPAEQISNSHNRRYKNKASTKPRHIAHHTGDIRTSLRLK